jgi:hypothetical protein
VIDNIVNEPKTSNCDLTRDLETILYKSPLFQVLFEKAFHIKLQNWYVAGGCVTQTIWNFKCGFNPLHGLKDVDLVYYDASHSEIEEEQHQKRISNIFSNLQIPVEIVNEALVHKWYPQKFGYKIAPYYSSEDGIRTWLPAFALGVRIDRSGFKSFSPFGLEDTFEMIVRPNRSQVNEEIYYNMVNRLKKDWPSIQVIEW